MIRAFLFIIFILTSKTIGAQTNCNYFLTIGDTCRYEACDFLEKQEVGYYQFDMRQVKIYEKAISICPRYSYPYREIAAPYIKSGHFIQWKKYIDLAVKHDTLGHLGSRASLRSKFFADYKGALADIELLQSMTQDVGYSHDGAYHLNVIKALCLKQLGQTKKAIRVLEDHMWNPNYLSGLYECLHLGVMYKEVGQLDQALRCFREQEKENDLAEVHYYISKIYTLKGKHELATAAMNKAIQYYIANRRMFDGYSELIDEISLGDIE